jgi:hypothetical protein
MAGVRVNIQRTGVRLPLPVRSLAFAGAGGSLLLALLGQLPDVGVPYTGPFGLDAEYWFASMWSAALLLAAAYVTVAYGQAVRSPAAAVLGAFFAFMGVDEYMAIHERVEKAAGVDWQILYAPLVLVGGVACLLVIRAQWHARHRIAVRLLFGGGILWCVAQLLEKIQWDGDRQVSGYYAMATAEELFEMLGSLMFGLAMLIALQAVTSRRDAPATVG